MSNIICKKCGAEATSKCPYCRNIFPEEQLATVYSSLVSLTVGRPAETEYLSGHTILSQDIEFKLRFNHFPDDTDTPEDHLLDLLKGFLNLEHPKQAVCNHSWEFKPGETSSIGCGHGSKASKEEDGEVPTM